ncbi:hypothetical protein EVC45_27585 [Paraburkholderia sp. UYCP14C]|uniref:hypothetical protein n=1 Tax=Paraburkholderia sp. UYCP14C TaxID=2511130 RepID=UPI00101F1EB2|nr:hypothetical protein [Paraburkholderia sp. UYCP14C]RZF26491.1 hypothetical protein EVC45_27585 [Paraburkholderia sp. UYCP14C]
MKPIVAPRCRGLQLSTLPNVHNRGFRYGRRATVDISDYFSAFKIGIWDVEHLNTSNRGASSEINIACQH